MGLAGSLRGVGNAARAADVEEMSRHFSSDLTLVHAYGAEALARSPRAVTDPELPPRKPDFWS
jgi:hypothetical protein